MTSSFKYTFVKSTLVTSSFPVGYVSSSLSFSADGNLLAVGKDTSPSSVSFLNINDGSSARKVENYFSGLFLRTEANKILLSREGPYSQLFRRDPSGALTWSMVGSTWASGHTAIDSSQADNFFAVSGGSLYKGNSMNYSSYGCLHMPPTAIACAHEGISLVLGYGDGVVVKGENSDTSYAHPPNVGTKAHQRVEMGKALGQ
ncbi:hypothetical protein BDP27DRAFT_1425184 [Rhodocollybia butyracea]|uniref:Uncharacterized protein n=1 Tax=Rhodocollybia butyracea TaxID=206335 RepID=A0A9P5PM21_9AGAR|nr:hypothetical protein BDP27DRAFT_1425184 [Rhodocollybia butyracea]